MGSSGQVLTTITSTEGLYASWNHHNPLYLTDSKQKLAITVDKGSCLWSENQIKMQNLLQDNIQ